MNHSPTMMWGCAALLVLAIAVSLAFGSVAYLAFAVPCILMMGAMMWMMMGGPGSKPRNGTKP
jgi:branched-subunit amino acid ABC-type transport system permease component